MSEPVRGETSQQPPTADSPNREAALETGGTVQLVPSSQAGAGRELRAGKVQGTEPALLWMPYCMGVRGLPAGIQVVESRSELAGSCEGVWPYLFSMHPPSIYVFSSHLCINWSNSKLLYSRI